MRYIIVAVASMRVVDCIFELKFHHPVGLTTIQCFLQKWVSRTLGCSSCLVFTEMNFSAELVIFEIFSFDLYVGNYSYVIAVRVEVKVTESERGNGIT